MRQNADHEHRDCKYRDAVDVKRKSNPAGATHGSAFRQSAAVRGRRPWKVSQKRLWSKKSGSDDNQDVHGHDISFLDRSLIRP